MTNEIKPLKFNTMNTKTTNPEVLEIVEIINDMNENELIDLNNTYCQSANIYDSEIFSNDDDFFQTFFGTDVMKAVRAVHFGDYSYYHNYVKFNGYGNLESMDRFTTDDLCEYPETIAEYILANKYDFQHLFNGIL